MALRGWYIRGFSVSAKRLIWVVSMAYRTAGVGEGRTTDPRRSSPSPIPSRVQRLVVRSSFLDLADAAGGGHAAQAVATVRAWAGWRRRLP